MPDPYKIRGKSLSGILYLHFDQLYVDISFRDHSVK